MEDVSIDCDRCGKRRHSFCNDTVGDLLNYLCEPRPCAKKYGIHAQRQYIRFALYSELGNHA